jgi:hypothetical protein
MSPITFSLKQFEEPDDASLCVELFYMINGTMVTFNANLVDSFTPIPNQTDDAMQIRLNNHDGTHLERVFQINNNHIREISSSVAPPRSAQG